MTKTIKLSKSKLHTSAYRVEQVTDSVEYDPGQYLDRKTVQDLCAARAWKVTIVERK